MSRAPQLFAGPFIERRAELRDDPQWLSAARSDPDTRYVLTAGPLHLVHAASLDVALLPNGHALIEQAQEASFTLLGWFRGARTVLVEYAADAAPATLAPLPEATEFRELRPIAPLLQSDAASLLAYSRALVHWRARHRFCGVCGAPNLPSRAGHVMRCTACATETFPRLDPAVIVLVADATGDRALLGRQSSWPAGRYSTIAGFVEPGERLEDAVAREVEEETGVQVTDVHYVASQPWPFPSSLMLGFRALARTQAIELRDGELEDARWFSRAEIAAGHPALPPTGSISARLIAEWLGQPLPDSSR